MLNAKVQAGDNPAEDPNQLIKEFEELSNELTSLVQRINRTNSNVITKDGRTISDDLATRDILALKRSAYRSLAEKATITQDRYSNSEIKFESTVNVAKMQKQADLLAKEYRELDTKIQELNWLTELLE